MVRLDFSIRRVVRKRDFMYDGFVGGRRGSFRKEREGLLNGENS